MKMAREAAVLMNFQKHRSHCGSLQESLSPGGERHENTCVLVKHGGKTKPTETQLTGKTQQV